MKIYISGKISGLPFSQVQAKFRSAQEHLESLGYTVVNPLDNGLSEQHTWAEHMLEDIKMLFECDAVYLLSDWADSRGAIIEKYIAEISGKQVLSQTKEDLDKAAVARQEMTFYRVESAIHEVTGWKRKDYAIYSKKQEFYFVRVIYIHLCYKNGVLNKSLLARRVGKNHTTAFRSLSLYPEEYKYNATFRRLADQIEERLSAIIEGSQMRVAQALCESVS